MKNQIFTLLFSFFFALCMNAQPYLEWDKRYNGPVGNDYGKLITVDDIGNVYVAGVSDGDMKDVIIIKYNSLGDTLWTMRYNADINSIDEPNSLKIDNQGNVYITGKATNGGTKNDFLTIKCNANGEIQWAKTYGLTYSEDSGYDLVVDFFGNVYVVGTFNGVGMILKYNSGGGLVWYKSKNYDLCNIILINHVGNLIVSATNDSYYTIYRLYEMDTLDGSDIKTYNTHTYYPEEGLPIAITLDNTGSIYVMSHKKHFSAHYDIAYTAKYSYGNGIPVWTNGQSVSSNSIKWKLIGMVKDNENNLYQLRQVLNNKYYYQLRKIGISGEQQWNSTFESATNADEFPVGISLSNITNPNEIILAGYNSLGDIRLLKYDNDGEIIWNSTYDCGNSNSDTAQAMVLDKCDNMFITGSSNCNNTYQDIKTIKYSTLEKPVINTLDPPIVCLGNEISLSVDECSGCTYLWSTGQTTSSIMVSPDVTTEYIVTVSLPQNCPIVSEPLTIVVNPLITPMLTITESQNNICAGQNVIFTATPINGGENPAYNWMINDVSQQSGSSNTFAASTLDHGDNITCLMTSNVNCLTNLTALSNEIDMIVHPILTASVQIEATNTEICSGQSVTFTANSVNGGASPGYKWYVNDILQGETSSIFNATGLENGAVVKAEMVSSEACVEPGTATSNSISIMVNPILTPEVSILASKNTICEGGNIMFTASAVNGGTNPVFNWYINNDLQESHESTFSTTTLVSGSQVHCVMTSNETCLAQPSETSNVITIEVFKLVTPTVAISESQNNICYGQNVIFTAVPVNGGENPVYNWMLNDESQQNSTSNSFAANTLDHGDKISCLMTSNSICLTNPTALSNEVEMIIHPILTTSVQIEATSSEICSGQSVTFTANPVNGGVSPGYKWYVNDLLQGETSSIFNATGLENGAVIKAEMVSSEACVEPGTVTSNSITITVNPLLTPEVSILASKNSICEGENITFTATTVNGGTNPIFNWYINNDLQESHESTFSTTTLASGSQVYCLMTSNEVCLAQTLATSNFVSVAVNPLLTPNVVINASSTAVFSCEQVTFTPTPTHGGLNPTYKWLINGNIVSTVSTFVTSSLVNGAQVQCIMTSSANCVTTPMVGSDIITMTVFPLPQPELRLRLDTISVTNYSGSQFSYIWYFNGTMISTQPSIVCSAHGNGSYYVVVKLNNCTVTSNTYEFDCATYTNEIDDNTKFIIYPNPTNGVIKIEGEQLTSGTFNIELRNVLGILISNQLFNVSDIQLKTEFDLNKYPEGMYMIVINSDTFRKVFSINKFN